MPRKTPHHANFEQQEKDHEFPHSILNGVPGRDNGQNGEEGCEQNQQYAEPVHAEEVLDVQIANAEPRHSNNHL